MIQKAIQYLVNELNEVGLFQKVYGLTELIEIDGKVFPMFYLGNGKYEKNFSPNKWYGNAYFRKNGSITFPSSSFTSYKPCEVPIGINIPLTFVSTIKRSKLKCDSNYSSDFLAFYISGLFENVNGLRAEIDAKRVVIKVDSFTTDAKEIVDSELKGLDNTIKTDYAYLMMNLSIQIDTTKACMPDYCDGVIIDEVPNEVADQNENNLIAR